MPKFVLAAMSAGVSFDWASADHRHSREFSSERTDSAS
jgi:hypothetical protein